LLATTNLSFLRAHFSLAAESISFSTSSFSFLREVRVFRFSREILVLAICLSVTVPVSFSCVKIFNPTAGSYPWFQLPSPQISAPVNFGSFRFDSVLSFRFATVRSKAGAFCSSALVDLAKAACFPSVSCSLAVARSFQLSSSVLVPDGSCCDV
jgi:hypothetical protein